MATRIKGSYSKGIKGGFDEDKRHLMKLVQKDIPWVDADENRADWMRFTTLRRMSETLIGNASPNDGFKAVGDSATNDFIIKGGDGTLDGAGRLYVAGHGCFLKSDVRYVNNGMTEDQRSIYPKNTGIVGTDTIDDATANYDVNGLVGRTITPDVTQPGVTATILSNTQTTITVNIDLVAAGIPAGAHYRLELSTPGSPPRNDDVYINVFVDEIDGFDDPGITHDFGTQLAAQYFLQLQQVIFVKEGGGPVATTYIDADGVEHFLLKIATVNRNGAAIAPGEVTDLRATSGTLTSFVKKSGDTMSGDLTMAGSNIIMTGGGTITTDGSINMSPGQTVDGRDVSVDGAKLDTITWTGAGVGSILPLRAERVQGINLLGVTTQVINVSGSFKGKSEGGDEVTKGVVSDPPLNRAETKELATKDDIFGPAGEKVFGRVTFVSQITLTDDGSPGITFQNASQTVTGTGTQFTTELQIGDIILAGDGFYYTVQSIIDNLTLQIDEAYPSATQSVTNTLRRRWNLSLFYDDEGTETPFTPSSAVDIDWYYKQVFSVDEIPTFSGDMRVPSDQVAADIPDGTETLKGKVQFAPDGDTSPSKAVQGNDQRLLPADFAEVAAALAAASAGVDFNGQRIINVADPDPAPAGLQQVVTRNFLDSLGFVIPKIAHFRSAQVNASSFFEWSVFKNPDSFANPSSGANPDRITFPENGWYKCSFKGIHEYLGVDTTVALKNGVDILDEAFYGPSGGGPAGIFMSAPLEFLIDITDFTTDFLTIQAVINTVPQAIDAEKTSLVITKVRNI